MKLINSYHFRSLVCPLLLSLCYYSCKDEDIAKRGTCYLTKVSYPISSPLEFEYDDAKRLSKMDDSGFDRAFTYNSEGQLSEDAWFDGMCKITQRLYSYSGNTVTEEYRLALQGTGCPPIDGFSGKVWKYTLKDQRVINKTSSNFGTDSIVYSYKKNNSDAITIYTRPSKASGPFVVTTLSTYEYDDRHNPWHIYRPRLKDEAFADNNVIRVTIKQRTSYAENQYNEQTISYAYTYNEHGYPLTRTGGYQDEQFEYICPD